MYLRLHLGFCKQSKQWRVKLSCYSTIGLREPYWFYSPYNKTWFLTSTMFFIMLLSEYSTETLFWCITFCPNTESFTYSHTGTVYLLITLFYLQERAIEELLSTNLLQTDDQPTSSTRTSQRRCSTFCPVLNHAADQLSQSLSETKIKPSVETF